MPELYSQRKNKNVEKLGLLEMRKRFFQIYKFFQEKDYFQQKLGKWKRGYRPSFHLGEFGSDIEGYIEIEFGNNNFWPIENKYEDYSEDDLFDAIEFLHISIAKPVDSFLNSHNTVTGITYYDDFSSLEGRKEFRNKINKQLELYKTGFSLNETGFIQHSDPMELEGAIEELKILNVSEPEAHCEMVLEAQRLYNQRDNDLTVKQNAVRLIGDALEYIRPKIREGLSKQDEADLFNILNNFGVRHNNQIQKNGYDKEIFVDWMYSYFMSAYVYSVKLLQSKGITV